MNNEINSLDFNGTTLDVIERDGQLWLTAEQVGYCLGYANGNVRDGVIKLYNRNADEFTAADTCVVKLTTQTVPCAVNLTVQGQAREMRLFSATGCNLLGFFSNTARAKEFRIWAKTVLAGQPVVMVPPDSTAAKLDRLLDGVAGLLTMMPRVLDVMEQMLSTMPKMLEATHPKRGRPTRKRMHVEDLARIEALRAKGYTLDELVAETEFSQSQCWSVVAGRYKVLESGRVSIDLRSDAARAADAAAKAERRDAGGAA